MEPLLCILGVLRLLRRVGALAPTLFRSLGSLKEIIRDALQQAAANGASGVPGDTREVLLGLGRELFSTYENESSKEELFRTSSS